MTVENTCPSCQQALIWQDNQYYCQDCSHYLVKNAACPDCEAQMEKLQACGSASYFCHTCNELKSKSRARISFSIVTN
ncbi:zinc ribbon domain-containing protein [Photobacterium jeanii]|uniref:zinc ribbon domain-containing protein n=1 Tax=Photobacterium jeanii TaxID=858640 RepID=UPI000A94AEE6|nr:zinc ribbon domain-containing protein [Photobacterium jeanii]